MAMPKRTVIVTDKKFKIKQDKKFDIYGEFDPNKNLVTINPDKQPANTLLHEILHIISGEKKLGLSEQQVEKLETWLCDMFCNNRELGHWIVNNSCRVPIE